MIGDLGQQSKSRNIIEELYGHNSEVIKFLNNRSQWFAVREIDELRQMKHVPFAVVHYSLPFQDLVARYDKGRFTGNEFLIGCEEVRKANARAN